VFFNPYVTPQDSGSIPWRRGELGGSNGHCNAHSVALVQQVLACGGAVGNVRLLSEEGCARVLEEQANGNDLVMNLPMRWGLGYCIGSPLVGKIYGQRAEGRRLAFWGGSGGSWAFNDLDARMTVAFVPKAHVDGAFDQRSIAVVKAAYDCLILTT
jgi:hypothetical protein